MAHYKNISDSKCEKCGHRVERLRQDGSYLCRKCAYDSRKIKTVSVHKIAEAVNKQGEPPEGLCPICGSATILKKIIDNPMIERKFKDKTYYCYSCKEAFNELKTGY